MRLSLLLPCAALSACATSPALSKDTCELLNDARHQQSEVRLEAGADDYGLLLLQTISIAPISRGLHCAYGGNPRMRLSEFGFSDDMEYGAVTKLFGAQQPEGFIVNQIETCLYQRQERSWRSLGCRADYEF